MDEIVKQAMGRWPDVPHCFGWLGLDGRGDWFLRDQPSQDRGAFSSGVPGAKGSRLEHAGLIAFIQRNYASDEVCGTGGHALDLAHLRLPGNHIAHRDTGAIPVSVAGRARMALSADLIGMWTGAHTRHDARCPDRRGPGMGAANPGGTGTAPALPLRAEPTKPPDNEYRSCRASNGR